MDAQRFDRLTQSLAGSRSRRKVIASVATGILASAFGRDSTIAQSDCPPEYAMCAGQCRFLARDYHHCGGCGIDCGDSACIDGMCAPCESIGLTTCHDPVGETNYCANTFTSWNDCGDCGNRCTTGPCENGVCVSTAECDDGLTECMGQCADLRTSVSHCGACGNACMGVAPTGQSSVGVCVEGNCEIVCLEGYSVCNDGERDFCADLAFDNDNCGFCGFVCTSGTCVKGICEEESAVAEDIETGFTGPPDALAFALSIEDASLALFRQGLATFPSEAFEGMPRDTRTRLGIMRDHDKEHGAILELLLAQMGTEPQRGDTPTIPFIDAVDFIERAHRLKELATAGYALLLPAVPNGSLLLAIARIPPVEGRHAAWLATRAGEPAFTDPLEPAMTREEIEQGLADVLA